MATILTKKKDTTGAPSSGDLTNSSGGAELAVNTADKRLYTKDSGGSVVEVGINPGTAVTFTAGTNSAPAITTTGDTNTGIFFPAADTIAFTEGGAEAMRIDSSGNVGIGTTSPGAQLEVSRSATNGFSTIRWSNTGASGRTYEIGLGGDTASADFANKLYFYDSTAAANRMIIDSAGNVGIGTSSPAYVFQVNKTPATNSFNGIAYEDSTTVLGLFKTGSSYTFGGVGSSQAWIYSNTGDLNITSDGSGVIKFQGQNGAERARIDSSGNLLIGYTSSNGAFLLQVNSQIFATNATISTSDGRYKENIQSLDGALDLVAQLNPVQFSWKEHPVHNFDRSGPTVGFIAQEVQQVLANKPYLNSIIKANECVIEPEEKDSEGNVTKEAVTEEFLGISEGNMIAILTKAIQELKAEFDAYKASHL
jgi:hypothetical protein